MKTLKILVMLDSFKDCLSSLEASKILAQGLEEVSCIKCEILPISDGGEGFIEAIQYNNTQWQTHTLSLLSPYSQEISAKYLIDGKNAILEMAQSSGLTLTPSHQRRTLYATSYGLGEMIIQAIENGARKIIIGIGGSATNDCGIGCLQALGVKFYDSWDTLLPMRASAIDLSKIVRFELTDAFLQILKTCEFIVPCDVRNPLLGSNGATYVYGRQKGIQGNDLEILESGMQHFSAVVEEYFQQSFCHIAGSGAAGGMGFSLQAFLNAKLQSGIETLLDSVNATEKMQGVDLVITGEGRLDNQSIFGKAPIGIAKLAHSLNKPIIAVCGSLGEGYETLHSHHIQAMFSLLNKPMSLEDSMSNAPSLLRALGRELGGILSLRL